MAIMTIFLGLMLKLLHILLKTVVWRPLCIMIEIRIHIIFKTVEQNDRGFDKIMIMC